MNDRSTLPPPVNNQQSSTSTTSSAPADASATKGELIGGGIGAVAGFIIAVGCLITAPSAATGREADEYVLGACAVFAAIGGLLYAKQSRGSSLGPAFLLGVPLMKAVKEGKVAVYPYRFWMLIVGPIGIGAAGARIGSIVERFVWRLRGGRKPPDSTLPVHLTLSPIPRTMEPVTAVPLLPMAKNPTAIESARYWTNPRLPWFGQLICIYALILNPLLWLGQTFDTLLEGIYRSDPLDVSSLLEIFHTAVGLVAVVVMVVGALHLRALRPSGPLLFMAAVVGNFVFQLLVVVLYVAIVAPPSATSEPSVVGLIVFVVSLLLSLMGFLLEVAATIWFLIRRKQLAVTFSESAGESVPELPLSSTTAIRLAIVVASLLGVGGFLRALRSH